jgi:hypothetical protein
MAKKLFLAGNEEDINKVKAFVFDNDLLGKGKIFLIDFNPDLTEEYQEENFKD